MLGMEVLICQNIDAVTNYAVQGTVFLDDVLGVAKDTGGGKEAIAYGIAVVIPENYLEVR